MWFQPGGGAQAVLIAAITAAATHIDACCYELTATAIADALIAARVRGVAIRIICDHHEAMMPASTATKLYEAGVPIRLDSLHHIMHHKYAVLDGGITFTGSYNWSDGAEHANAENLLRLADTNIASVYLLDFEHHWEHSVAM